MPDETCKKVLPVAQSLEFRGDRPAEVVYVSGCEVRKPREFRVVPHALVRIQLRGVGGKSMSSNMVVTSQVLSHVPRVVMDIDPVPDDREWSLDLTTEESKEFNDVLRVGIPVVLEELEIEPQSMPLGADGEGTDRRDPVVTVPALLDRGLSPRRKGSPHQGREHEAGFVEEN